MKLLTVTVPCYNSQDYMRNCIESLLPGGERVEIIIIDDGSKDNTGLIADEYAAKYPTIVKAIHQPNGGHGEGINQGLAHATGRYFKVVDSDDKVSEDFDLFLDTLEECEARGGVDLMVCLTLPHVAKMYYFNADLYRYWIGREGQSVQKDVMMKRYAHQVLCTELCFKSFYFDSIKSKMLRKYLEHEMFLMFGISILYARMNKSEETDKAVSQMWENCRAHDRKWADHFRQRSMLTFLHFPGAMGHTFNDVIYKIAMSVVRYD